MTTHLLSPEELLSTGFVRFLVHSHKELKEPLKKWIVQSKSLRSSESFQAFLKTVPDSVLKAAQQEYIRQGKPDPAKLPAAGAGGSTSSMSQQPGRPPGQQNAAAAQQLRYAAATPGVGQQYPASGGGYLNSQQLLQLQQPGRVSPGPGQAVTALAGANPQTMPQQFTQVQLQQLLQIQQLQARQQQLTPANLQQLLQAQQLTALQQAQMRAAQQQQAGQAGKRPGAGTAAASAAQQGAAKKAPGLSSVGSGGNLQALVQQNSLQQHAAAAARLGSVPNLAAVGSIGQQRPLQAGGLAMTGIRPGGLAGAGAPGLAVAGAPGILGVGTAGVMANSLAQQQSAIAQLEARNHLAQLKPGEQPRIQLPDTHEWVQCLGKDGLPTWAAMPKSGAVKYRAEQKRKADVDAGILPAAKVAATAGAGGVVRRRIDDDYTAGAGDRALDVMADDELQAELAVNEAAKGAVQVQQGNVQEEYILNQGPVLQLIAGIAKKHGVRQVSEDLYAFLSLAADAHLSQLLHGLVKSRLQREDIGKSYQGVEKQDDNVRGRLFQMQKREREAAREREEKERDELAKLSGTRKKLADEDKKLAKEAQQRKQLEQQQKILGTTLSKMGIGRKAFGLAAIGRPPGAPAARAGAGFTKPEVVEAKAAAAANGPAGAAAPTANGTAGLKQESGSDAGATNHQQQLGPGGTAGAPAAGVPPLKPVTLQHQLLSAANAAGGPGAAALVSFVAGGASASKVEREGEEGLREIMLKDLIAVLERHPLYCRSQLLYSLYVLVGQTQAR